MGVTPVTALAYESNAEDSGWWVDSSSPRGSQRNWSMRLPSPVGTTDWPVGGVLGRSNTLKSQPEARVRDDAWTLALGAHAQEPGSPTKRVRPRVLPGQGTSHSTASGT